MSDNGINIDELLMLLGQRKQAQAQTAMSPADILAQYNAYLTSGTKTAKKDATSFLIDQKSIQALNKGANASNELPKGWDATDPTPPDSEADSVRSLYGDETYNKIFNDIDNGVSLPSLSASINGAPEFDDADGSGNTRKAILGAVTDYAKAKQKDTAAMAKHQTALASTQASRNGALTSFLADNPDIGGQIQHRNTQRDHITTVAQQLLAKHAGPAAHPIAGLLPTPAGVGGAMKDSAGNDKIASYIRQRAAEAAKKLGL